MDEQMRAIVIREFGGPEVLKVERVPLPRPGPGQVRVRVSTSGINRADLLQRVGRYPAPEGWPQEIPGLEFAGVIDSVGERVTTAAVGDRVMGIVGGGGYAEFVLTDADALIGVPEGLALDEAGALPEAFLTAFDAVFVQEELEAGETLLVHAVGSGVGTAALQMARALGARVIGTSRTPNKLDRAGALGLEQGVLGDEHWPAAVMDLTGGRGADVILDLVGGPYLEGNQTVLARRGRHIVVGVPGGPEARVNLRALMRARGSIRGTVLRARAREEKAALVRAFSERIGPLLEAGEVRPVVDSVLPAEEAPAAHRRVADNLNFGKVLLAW